MVYTMNIIVYRMCPWLSVMLLYMNHDEWSKSLNFQFTCNVQRCPDDVEFLGRYAMRVIIWELEHCIDIYRYIRYSQGPNIFTLFRLT